MDVPYSGFLDDTSASQVNKSPAKTSTVAKESIKWNEDAFFKRQVLPQSSESLFITPAESPISASKEALNKKESMQKPVFDLTGSSFISEKANSSLGILNIENFSGLSDTSFQSTRNVKQKKKKKLERNNRVSSEEKNSTLENSRIEERLNASTEDILEEFEGGNTKNTDAGSNSSSDIEYDGRNIPELNMDCDILSLIHSKKSSFDTSKHSKSSTFIKENNDISEAYTSCSEFQKSELSNSSHRENAESKRSSIFNCFQPSYESLYEEPIPEENVEAKGKKGKAPKTIKVCPFLDISSFEIEPILQKSGETSTPSSIENTRCNQELSVDFCPEQISARSSSFKSSIKYDTSKSEISNISHQNKSTFNCSKISLPNEGLENEVLCGSALQIMEPKFELMKESILNQVKNSERFSKSNSSVLPDVPENGSRLSDLPFKVNSSGFGNAENWCSSQLGLSESDFFNSDAAKEMLKKDLEDFQKEQFIPNKVSGSSNWSPPSRLEVTAPSWFDELRPSLALDSDRHISIGTLISARSEKLGSLSNDNNRERPSFGVSAISPPENRDSSISADGSFSTFKDKIFKNGRISELLDDISLTDPCAFASKLVEKCESNMLKENPSNTTKSSECGKLSEILEITDNSMSNSGGSDTFVKSSDSNLSRETYTDTNIESKSVMEHSDTYIRSSDSNVSREAYTDANVECKSAMEESDRTSLNYTVQSSSDRGSIKTTKSDGYSSCSLPSSHHNATQEFSRPESVCSSACSSHISTDKALCLQYGCNTKYLSSGVEHNQNGMANSLPAGSTVSCPHICLHGMQPNILPFGVCNPLQSVFQNALSGFSSGTSAPCHAIQAPSELYFPEKIALGDSQEMMLTVRNSSEVAHYRVTCVSAYLNDSPLPYGMSGLNFSNSIVCNVGNATDVKLIIAPKYEGKFEVNLQIDAFVYPVGQNSIPSATVKTKIQYNVVRPHISMLYKGKSSLNLGTVITGSSFVEYVTITNNSEVAVPLRISISNDTVENQIYFGLKEMDRQKHYFPGALRFLSPTVLLYRMPALKDKNMPPSLDIPVVFESIKGSVISSITAAIETPTLIETLGFIKISATVGNAVLRLKYPDQNPLVLRADKGASCSHNLTVMNDGSLSVVYDIHIDGDNDVLFVSPNSLSLQPKQCATISVTFAPQANCKVKGNLLAAAEPHGQVFVLTEIIGHVKESYSNRPESNYHQVHDTRPTRESINSICESSCLIECDKKYLAWGGIDIGSNVLKTFTVRNPKEEPIQVKVFIKEKTNGFMLLDESNQNRTCYKLTIEAKGGKDLSAIFLPKDVISYSGYLYIKPVTQGESKVFTLPLSGYGGTSKLKVLGLSMGEKADFCMDIDAAGDTDNIYKNITLHNSGLRPAFVKLFATGDNLVENLISKQIFINPSEFVLLENEKKNVCISINGAQRKQISKAEVINIVYGDELLRQRLKRISKSGPAANGKTYNENFTAYFDGEEKVAFDSTYGSTPKDEALFHTSLKKIKIHVFFNGLNTSFSRTSFGPLSEIQDNFTNLTLDSTALSNSTVSSKFRRMTIENCSPPVKESTVHSINRLSLPIPFCENLTDPLNTDDIFPSITNKLNDMKLDTWSVSPKELVIDADNKEKRILLKNHSNSDMRFKVEYSIDVITVSPFRGTLSAKGEIGLRITLINTNHNKLSDDYHENIKICCDGEEKNVSIIVLKDKRAKNASPMPPVLNDSLRSGFLGESDFLDSTVAESTSRPLNIDNIFKFPKEIDLYSAKLGVLSETVLVVGNPSKETVMWSICPVSLMFAEPFDDSIDSSCSAIEFKNTSGAIKPMTTENIVIKFFPQSVACYQQFFKLTLTLKNGTSQTFNIKVQGKAAADLSFTARNSEVTDKSKGSSTTKKKAKSELFTESDIYKFPLTVSGQKSSEGVIVKNISSQDFKLSIVKPQLPFIVNYSTCLVKSKKFYRIPVSFKPLRPGKFESEVKFVSEDGNELKVQLIGLCTA